jgi:hypothetical protein
LNSGEFGCRWREKRGETGRQGKGKGRGRKRRRNGKAEQETTYPWLLPAMLSDFV